jgi:hypothetical protein
MLKDIRHQIMKKVKEEEYMWGWFANVIGWGA